MEIQGIELNKDKCNHEWKREFEDFFFTDESERFWSISRQSCEKCGGFRKIEERFR